ncbi:MAG: aldose epimerase family protein [Aeoliella sp.]
MPNRITKNFGQYRDGAAAELHTLRNTNGLEVSVVPYGATIQKIMSPDRNGEFSDIVLGFDSIEGYIGSDAYIGSVVGRYGNRIANGKFSLGGVEYTLAQNDGSNSLHGGLKGFDKAIWGVDRIDSARSITLSHISPNSDEGFPGEVEVSVVYTLTDENELRIEYRGVTDKATPLNLTNHAYFNLAGHGSGDILGHVVEIDASEITPVNDSLIPTGELQSVAGTPFDLRRATVIGDRIDANDEQIRRAGGYDHNWVLDGEGAGPVLAARVFEPGSGRILEVLTEEPGLQFYTGNFLDGKLTGKNSVVYRRRAGFCMETQHFPDSPNQPGFPSTILRPGEVYQSTTIYRFSS